MYPCRNHPHLPASRSCSHCRQPFCEQCTVEFLGQPHCGACRDLRLQWMQPAPQFTQKNPHHQLRENLLLASVVMFGVGGFLLNLGLLMPAAVIGGVMGLTLIAALVVHLMGVK